MLYDFKCTSCNHVFEVTQTLAEHDDGSGTVDCPECHMPAISTISNPRHYRHLSWSSWNVGDSS